MFNVWGEWQGTIMGCTEWLVCHYFFSYSYSITSCFHYWLLSSLFFGNGLLGRGPLWFLVYGPFTFFAFDDAAAPTHVAHGGCFLVSRLRVGAGGTRVSFEGSETVAPAVIHVIGFFCCCFVN